MSIFYKKDVNPLQMRKLDKIEKLIWKESTFSDLPQIPEIDDAWMRLEQRINITDTEPENDKNQAQLFSSIPTLRWKPHLASIVSMALFTLVCLPIVYLVLTTESVLTRNGIIETIILNDGSYVTLNSGSELTYKTDFNSNHRNIVCRLDGCFGWEDC